MAKSPLRYSPDGSHVYSYQTCIRQTLSDGKTVGNITWYSLTTTRHQAIAMSSDCNIVLSHVPEGTKELWPVPPDAALYVGTAQPVKPVHTSP